MERHHGLFISVVMKMNRLDPFRSVRVPVKGLTSHHMSVLINKLG